MRPQRRQSDGLKHAQVRRLPHAKMAAISSRLMPSRRGFRSANPHPEGWCCNFGTKLRLDKKNGSRSFGRIKRHPRLLPLQPCHMYRTEHARRHAPADDCSPNIVFLRAGGKGHAPIDASVEVTFQIAFFGRLFRRVRRGLCCPIWVCVLVAHFGHDISDG